ncbi:MAG: hypothetical protein IJL89_00350, partial [Firmicutes bacterium]|nr:hypothetical protein [Bacillota bacterium]
GTGRNVKKTVTALPAYSYKGNDPYTEAVCKKILNDHLYYYDKSSVSIPVPSIVDIDDKNQNDVKVWGLFWILNFDLNGDILETASGGEYPGCMHLKKTDSGYVVTRFDKTEEGSDYAPSLKKICENNEARIQKFSDAHDKVDEELKTILEEYVKANNLDIKAYQDYGWDPVMLDISEDKSGVFGEEVPEYFEFSSGAGGWHTELKLNKDGSFKGSFTDSEMGSTGEGYPNGTMYICEFNGSFTDISKNEDGSYSMRLADIKTVKEQDEEWIDEGIKYIASFPYGLEDGKDFVLYTPETATKDLSEEFLSWWPQRYDDTADKATLGCWGIYNKTTEYGFFAYDEAE